MNRINGDLKTLMIKSYGKAALAILISTIFAFLITSNRMIAMAYVNVMTLGGVLPSWLSSAIIFILLMTLMNRMYRAKSTGMVILYFIIISIFFSGTITALLLSYSIGKIAFIFGVTIIYFLSLGLFAMITNKDFTKLSNVMFIALISLVIVSIIAMFFSFTGLELILTIGSLIIFTIYTIIDHQYMVREAQHGDRYGDNYTRVSYQYGLNLYIDFINLLTSIMRITNN